MISGAANGGNVYVLFSDGTSVRATVAGRDILTDLGVLKVDPPFDLTAIKIGQSNSVHVGQPVVAMDTADQLIEHGTVTHATFGLEAVPIPPSAAAPAGTPQGLFVQGVATRGPAANAGIQPGDVITKIDGEDATSSLQLETPTLTKSPGDTVDIDYWPEGHTATATVTLGSASQT